MGDVRTARLPIWVSTSIEQCRSRLLQPSSKCFFGTQAGYGATTTRRMLRATDISTTVGVVVATNSTKDQAAVMQTLGNTIKSGIFPARLNSAGVS